VSRSARLYRRLTPAKLADRVADWLTDLLTYLLTEWLTERLATKLGIELPSVSITNPLRAKLKYFSIQYSLFFFKQHCLFGKFTGFACLSFHWAQHADKDERGALVEWYLQEKTVVKDWD
jgi:hypothetical protein